MWDTVRFREYRTLCSKLKNRERCFSRFSLLWWIFVFTGVFGEKGVQNVVLLW
jgi:hypothetical protein